MKILLAGYNVDCNILKELKNQNLVTPETVSAAYARISRSSKDVTTLRLEALNEVEKSRSSNENIIYEMGHSSIAEHAVFNLDIIGISRLISELIHRSRLASFTEKSQRYVTLKGDYVIPEEISGNEVLKNKFISLINLQNELYFTYFDLAKKYLEKSNTKLNKKELEGRAKEDARYFLSLSSQTQMGVTINGRSLERLLRRLDQSELIEAKELKNAIESQVKPVAPSIVKYTNKDVYGLAFPSFNCPQNKLGHDVEICESDPNGESKILIAYLIDHEGYTYHESKSIVDTMTIEDQQKYFSHIFSGIKSYHALPRSFEATDYSLAMKMSSSCFAQLKRHRMASIFKSKYHPSHGYVIPPLIKEIGISKEVECMFSLSEELFYEFEAVKKGLGDYCLTNAHVVNVFMKCNLRELYHFVRLRSDSHAQWEIKGLSDQLSEQLKQIHPNACQILYGKDFFNSLNKCIDK